jgi:hypothetical protein
MTTRRSPTVRVAIAVVGALVVGGCSDDGDTAPTVSTTPAISGADSTPPTTPTPTTPVATVPPPTTPPPTTPPTTSPPTTPPSTEAGDPTLDLKAEIAADTMFAWDVLLRVGLRPKQSELDALLTRAVVPGSYVWEQQRSRARDLRESGDRLAFGEPRFNEMTIENVELVGAAPHRQAFVTFCNSANVNRMHVEPDGSLTPSGPQAPFPSSFRFRMPLRLHEGTWKLYSFPPEASLGRTEDTTCGD